MDRVLYSFLHTFIRTTTEWTRGYGNYPKPNWARWHYEDTNFPSSQTQSHHFGSNHRSLQPTSSEDMIPHSTVTNPVVSEIEKQRQDYLNYSVYIHNHIYYVYMLRLQNYTASVLQFSIGTADPLRALAQLTLSI